MANSRSVKGLEPILRSNLLRLARAYAKARGGIKLRTVSRYAHGDGQFFDELAARDISFTARKYDEVRAWFESNRPARMRWPKLYEPWAAEEKDAGGA